MIEQLRRFLATPAGKITSGIVVIGILVLAFMSVSSFFKGDTPDSAFYTTFVCSETGKPFKHKNVIGEVPPILSPYSGKNTGYAAEACYWNKDGTPKAEPTWVLLNSTVGKPGPTFCPDCGRLVVERNPPAQEGRKAPPTQAEMRSR